MSALELLARKAQKLRMRYVAAEHPVYADVFVVARTPRGGEVEYVSASDGHTEDPLLARQFDSAEVALATAAAMNSGEVL